MKSAVNLDHYARARAAVVFGPQDTWQSFFIPGPLPGLNEMLAAAKSRRGNWSQFAELKRDCETQIVARIRAAKIRPMQTVHLVCGWYEPNRRRDLDNIVCARKFILDALVAAGILQTDGQRHVAGFADTFAIQPFHPGVHVTLIEEELREHQGATRLHHSPRDQRAHSHPRAGERNEPA